MDDRTAYDPHLAGFAPFRGLEGPARVFIVLVCGVAATDVAALVTNAQVISFAGALRSGEPSQAEITQRVDAIGAAVAAVSLAQLAFFLAAGISYIVWFHRAYTNLPRLGILDPRHDAGWAIAGWLVPGLSLFLPKRIHNDIWRASDPELPWNARRDLWDGTDLPASHLWWWLAFLVGGSLNPVSTVNPAAPALGSMWAWWSSALAVVGIVAAVLVVRIVLAVTARQRARAARGPWTFS